MVMKGHGHLASFNGYMEFLLHLLTNFSYVSKLSQ